MNTPTLLRYAGQLPLLVLLALALLPDMPWWSSAIGPWPLWLVALSAAALIRARCLSRFPQRSAALLILPRATAKSGRCKATVRKAA